MKKENGQYICDTQELNNEFQNPTTVMIMDQYHIITVDTEPALKEVCETWSGEPLDVNLSLCEKTQDWSHELDNIKVGAGVKSLRIDNSFIHRLDLSEAVNLVELTLHNNRALTEVLGLGENAIMQSIDLVGNPFRYDPDRIIANNPELECLKLDMLDMPRYPGLLERMVDDDRYGDTYILQEAINDMDIMDYSCDEVCDIANFTRNRLKAITTPDMSMEECQMAVMMDTMNLLAADEEYGGSGQELYAQVERMRELYPDDDEKAWSEAKIIHHRLSSQHTLLGAVMNTGVVCSGKSHYAKYMCEMLGIEAAVVVERTDKSLRQNKTIEYIGIDSSQHGLTPDHELVRTRNQNGKWQYTDVANDNVLPEENDDDFMYLTNLSLLDFCCIDNEYGNKTKNKVTPVEKEFENNSESMTGKHKKELVRSIDLKMGRERDLDHEPGTDQMGDFLSSQRMGIGTPESRLLADIFGNAFDLEDE